MSKIDPTVTGPALQRALFSEFDEALAIAFWKMSCSGGRDFCNCVETWPSPYSLRIGGRAKTNSGHARMRALYVVYVETHLDSQSSLPTLYLLVDSVRVRASS